VATALTPRPTGSRRPWLPLDRVAEGRRHYRMLIDAIHDALGERPPGKPPRAVLFGASLG
jgi:hypothetical protein